MAKARLLLIFLFMLPLLIPVKNSLQLQNAQTDSKTDPKAGPLTGPQTHSHTDQKQTSTSVKREKKKSVKWLDNHGGDLVAEPKKGKQFNWDRSDKKGLHTCIMTIFFIKYIFP
jgi:hypothetical protein